MPSVQAWLDATEGVQGVDMYSVATDINASRGNYPPPPGASDLPGLLSFEVLKLDVKAVLGFPGRGIGVRDLSLMQENEVVE